MPRVIPSAALLLVLLSPVANAQHRAIAPGPSLLLRAPAEPDTTPRRIPPTHWKEGAVAGGLVAGLGLGVFAMGLCRYSDAADSCAGAVPGAFLIGGIIGGTIGALIGGQFPKEDDPPDR